jgi:hypothetical protein
MKTFKNQSERLDDLIQEIEEKRNHDLNQMRSQFHLVYNELKPVNLLNQALVDIRETPYVRRNLLESVVSIAGGYLSKRMIMGESNSFFKKILGYGLQYGMTYFISKKIDEKMN